MNEYIQLFETEDVDFDLLRELNDENLRLMGVQTFGHRLRILRSVRLLGEEDHHEEVDDPEEQLD